MMKEKLKIQIVVETGLHIGGTETYEIGGIDNVVIKLPDGMPYIPGSSIKGKLRSIYREEYKDDGREIFGGEQDNNGKTITIPSKVIFRDMKIDLEETKKEFEKKYNDEDSLADWEEIYMEMKKRKFLEVKTEVRIGEDGKAENKTLRISERVVPGAVFSGEIIVRGGDKNKIKEILKNCAKELSDMDYLGGSGSRGYGQVKIEIISENNESVQDKDN